MSEMLHERVTPAEIAAQLFSLVNVAVLETFSPKVSNEIIDSESESTEEVDDPAGEIANNIVWSADVDLQLYSDEVHPRYDGESGLTKPKQEKVRHFVESLSLIYPPSTDGDERAGDDIKSATETVPAKQEDRIVITCDDNLALERIKDALEYLFFGPIADKVNEKMLSAKLFSDKELGRLQKDLQIILTRKETE